MTTQIASADLNSLFIFEPNTTFQSYQDGYIDVPSGSIKAKGTGRWSDLSGTTWNSFTNYILNNDPIRWTAPLIDLGRVDYFALSVDLDCDGDCEFLVSVSETGAFLGEERDYLIRNGDTNVPNFYGQFVYVTANVTGTELRRMTVTYDTTTKTILLKDVDTSTLSGSVSQRQIALPEQISGIVDLFIQPKTPTSYAVNLYVSDTANSQAVFPVVISKNASNPSFLLYGIDNDPRDSVIDIMINATPRMVMENNNLFII
jgi:hypothetical protein